MSRYIACILLINVISLASIEGRPFHKCHKLVHNGEFPKFEALYCSLNMVNSTEVS